MHRSASVSCGCNFEYVISDPIFLMDVSSISCDIYTRWMLCYKASFDENSTLVRIMDWCRQQRWCWSFTWSKSRLPWYHWVKADGPKERQIIKNFMSGYIFIIDNKSIILWKNVFRNFIDDTTIMMSSYGYFFHVIGPLWGESTSHRWISLTKGQWRGTLMFSVICTWTNGYANNRDAGVWDAIAVMMMSL